MKALKNIKFLVLMLVILTITSATALALTQLQVGIIVDSSVEYGSKMAIVGFIWPSGANYDATTGINGLPVKLQSRSKGATQWSDELDLTSEVVTDQGTTFNGAFSAEGTIIENTEFRVTFAGDANYSATDSNVETTLVEPKVSLKASKNAAKGLLTLKGTVAPTHRGKKVRIKAKKQGGGWSNLATVKTDKASNFKYDFKMAGRSGIFTFIAYFLADTDHTQGASKKVKARI